MPATNFTQIGSKGVIGMMFTEYERAQRSSWVDKVAITVPSNQAIETYAGIGTSPGMRKWLGGKQAKSFTKQSMTLSNEMWESTIRIEKQDLDRDKTGFLQAKISEQMDAAVAHDEELLSTLIDNGAATTYGFTYDAKALFATNHSVGDSGTINNSISVDISALPLGDVTGTHGTTTAPSVGEAALVVQAGIQAIMGFKDDNARPANRNIKEVVVMVPVALMAPFEAAMSSAFFAGGMVNPTLRQANPGGSSLVKILAVNPYLTWTTKIAVFRTDAPMKPFLIQLENGPNFVPNAEGSDFEFTEHAHRYSVEKSGNIGYLRFDRAVLVTMT